MNAMDACYGKVIAPTAQDKKRVTKDRVMLVAPVQGTLNEWHVTVLRQEILLLATEHVTIILPEGNGWVEVER
jgi:hypothetical protein